MITIRNPDEKKKMAGFSVADVIGSATRVLRECEMGGAEEAEGGWEVIVSRGVVVKGEGREGKGKGRKIR